MDQTKCIIITIGEEIVSGLIIDTNSAWLAKELYALGIEVHEIRSVKDHHDDMVNTIMDAFKKVPLVFLTGGLGPTKDDITKQALMDVFDCKQIFDEHTFRRIQKLFIRLGRTATEAHKQQAFMPEKAELLLNDMGTAPGMWFDEKGKVLLSMPGVPYEMKHLFTDLAIPKLQQRFSMQPIIHKILMTAGTGETVLAKEIEDVEDHLPEGISLAYLPGIASVRIRISGRGSDFKEVQKKVNITEMAIEERIYKHVYGYDNMPLAEAIGGLLKENNQTVSLAESCTGGRISHEITKNAGASDYFQGSIVCYSNEVKMKLLGVQKATLDNYGAVSAETVVEMAQGVLKAMKTDYSIAVSGVAGPGGGTEEKPVGTVWIACGTKDFTRTQLIQITKDRIQNIEYASMVALTLLRKTIIGLE